MEKKTLYDLLQLNDLDNTRITFNKKKDNVDPLLVFINTPDKMDEWTNWSTKPYKIGQTAVTLVKITDYEWLLVSIETITELIDLNGKEGIGSRSKVIDEYKKYFGKVIIHYHNEVRQYFRIGSEIIRDLTIKEILEKSFSINDYKKHQKNDSGNISLIDMNKVIIIDLNSGDYTKNKIGHELFNLEQNPIDGRFYGYCPPKDNIDIGSNFNEKNKNFVDGVLVVYVRKKQPTNNREIIGFCQNARVYGKSQSGKELSRSFIDKNGKEEIASYSIVSDNRTDLRNISNKFEININNFNNKMFRMQRVYGHTYPDLTNQVIDYVHSIIQNKELLDTNDNEEQIEIQKSSPASATEITESSNKPLNIVTGNNGKVILKDSKISKSALVNSNYKCVVNALHETFITEKEVSYMEGHHLIPCTVDNSEFIMKKYNKNIDCYENIVCICPNCHRAIHFGKWNEKEERLKILYKHQEKQFKKIGIDISEEELLDFYRKK